MYGESQSLLAWNQTDHAGIDVVAQQRLPILHEGKHTDHILHLYARTHHAGILRLLTRQLHRHLQGVTIVRHLAHLNRGLLTHCAIFLLKPLDGCRGGDNACHVMCHLNI